MMRTTWVCTTCSYSGLVVHESDADTYSVYRDIGSAHAQASGSCHRQNGVADMRVRSVLDGGDSGSPREADDA
jgi:hypothetical protein